MADNEKNYPFNKVQAENEMIEDVYAGPEFFEKGNDDASVSGVYAGPAYFNPPVKETPPEMFMCVYAGPDYYANQRAKEVLGMRGVEMAPLHAPETPPKSYSQDGSGRTCPFCGTLGIHGKFCPECGAPLPEEETAE